MAHFIELPAWRLESWREMTNRNAHGKCLEAIADYCATFAHGKCLEAIADYCATFAQGEARGDLEDLAGLFNKINARHEMRGHLPAILGETRRMLSEHLYTIIGREFGPDVLEKIYSTG